jgi:hypothetical protein
MKNDDRDKIHFKVWRFLEFEVIGKDAIRAGKPYMIFGAAFCSLVLVFLYSVQSSGYKSLIFFFAH